MMALGRRLAGVAAAEQSRLAASAGPALIVVDLAAIGAGDRAAYESSNPVARAEAVERQTGERPGTQTVVIALAMRTPVSRLG